MKDLSYNTSRGISLIGSKTVVDHKNAKYLDLTQNPVNNNGILYDPTPSIWNDNRPNIDAADETGGKISELRNNPKPGQLDAIGGAIVEISKLIKQYVVDAPKDNAVAEQLQQFNALKTAYNLVEKALNNTSVETMKSNYETYNVTAEQFKVDLTNNIFDGSLPEGSNNNYQKFLKSNSDRLINDSKKPQKKKQITK